MCLKPKIKLPAEGRDIKELGRLGEKTAVKLLRQNGYKILERNYTCPAGEMDIIAFEDKNIVMIEVKTSMSDGEVRPEERIDGRKKRHLTGIAEYYRNKKRVRDYAIRFDTVALVFGTNGKLKESRINKNAFEFNKSLR